MKTTFELLNEVVKMGIDKEDALKAIDADLDKIFGFEYRKPLMEEKIPDTLFKDILNGFICEREGYNEN